MLRFYWVSFDRFKRVNLSRFKRVNLNRPYWVCLTVFSNLQVNLFINKSICFYHNQIIAPDDFRQFVLLIVLAFCSLCYLFV